MNIETGNAASQPARRLGKLVPNPNARLRDQFHEVARFKYLSGRTEATYWQWVVRFLKFHRGKGELKIKNAKLEMPEKQDGAHGVARPASDGWKHPRETGSPEVQAYLSHLAVEKNVAEDTLPQAKLPTVSGRDEVGR